MRQKKNNTQEEDFYAMMPLIINSESHMTGDFILSTDVKLDGYVEGNIVTTKSVIIGEKGYLKGNLKCSRLKLYGCIEGISEITGSASIYDTASYTGKLNAASISVSPGSIVNADINLNGNKNGIHGALNAEHKNGFPSRLSVKEDKVPQSPGKEDEDPSRESARSFFNNFK